ncbi:MAG TPA: IPT/TIG domain-containing protein [Blastocatellia bacterium]|nr:IPT/TIG domain-containing protein [Blastocatellia bacterium]
MKRFFVLMCGGCLIFFALLAVSPRLPKSSALVNPEAPRVFLDTKYTPPAGNIIRVAPGGDLRAALNAALPGDTIELTAGATYTTPSDGFFLPKKTGTGWIVIRTSNMAGIPEEGTRVTPAHAAAMPKIVTTNVWPAVRTAPGAHHYRFIGIEFTVASNLSLNYGVVRLGDGSGQDSLTEVPHDIIIDRCYIHGKATGEMIRGVALNSARTAIIDSRIADFHSVEVDAQAIGGWNGPGPFKIVNNYLEATGENLMFGGAATAIANLVPSDIEIRRNHFFKPLRWRVGDPSYAGIHWAVKNLLELKSARRVLIDGNIFENCWADAQTGYAINLKTSNQRSGQTWAITEDVAFINNIVRHAAGGVTLLAKSEPETGNTRRIKIANNLFEDISDRWGGGGRLFQVNGPISNLTIDHNTCFQTNHILNFSGGVNSGFVFTNNIAPHNAYGVKGDSQASGTASLLYYAPGYQFARNAIAEAEASAYPANNYYLATLDEVGFVDMGAGDYRLRADSICKNAGTDGKDVGADMAAIAAAIQGGGTDAPPLPEPAEDVTVTAISPNSGPTGGGTQVTITGSGFVTGTTVLIGGVAATSVRVIGSASLSAVTPAHAAGTVNVVVRNPDGQSDTLANGFTYTAPASGETVLLADDFNDGYLNTSRWNSGSLFSGYTDSSLPLYERNQRLEIGPLLRNVTGSHYRGIRSASAYNFARAYCHVEVVQTAAAATEANAMLTVGRDVNNYYRIYVAAGSLICQKKVNGAKVNLFTVSYDPANHRFWRIRHDAATGHVVFETASGSGGAPGAWVKRRSEVWNTASVPLTAVLFELKAGTWQSEATAPGTVIFDNFRAAR